MHHVYDRDANTFSPQDDYCMACSHEVAFSWTCTMTVNIYEYKSVYRYTPRQEV